MTLPIPPDSWDSGLLLTFRRTPNGYGLVAVNDDGSPISGGGGGGNGGSSFPLTGSTSALAVSGSAVLVTYTVPALQTAFVGFNGFGDMYGKFQVRHNGLVIFSKTLNAANPAPSLMLPKPLLLADTDTIEVDVTNVGYSTGNYTATMLLTNTF